MPSSINGRSLSAGISVVVPVYNSEHTLRQLAVRLEAALGALHLPFELLLVNDGSRDGSWPVVASLAQTLPWVRGINLMRNFGQHNALLCGIRQASHEFVVTMDDDLQNPPEEISKLLAKLQEGFDVVYGVPQQMQHGVGRNLASRIAKLTLKRVMGVESADQASAFRIFRTRLRDAFADYHSPFVSIDVLLSYGTLSFTSAVVRHEPRRIGQSNYTLRKLVTHLLNTFTSFSTLPLQLASFIGFSMTVFGFVMLGYVLVRYLIQGSAVAGFPFLAALIAIFSGAQMFALGIIGEYLARIHSRSMGRPPFVVRQMTPAGESVALAQLSQG